MVPVTREARPTREKEEVGTAEPGRAVAEAEGESQGARSRSNGGRLDLHRERRRPTPTRALIGWTGQCTLSSNSPARQRPRPRRLPAALLTHRTRPPPTLGYCRHHALPTDR